MSDPMGIRKICNTSQQAASNTGSDNLIGNHLLNGTVGNGQYIAEKQSVEIIDTEARKKYLEENYVADHAGATLETYFEYAKSEYNLDKNKFLNLPQKLFEQYVKEIEAKIEANIDSMIVEIAKQTTIEEVENINTFIDEATKAKDEGLTTENAVKVTRSIIGKNIIEIINQYSNKEIKSLDDITHEELKAIIKTLAHDFIPNKNDDLKTQLDKSDTYRYLFRCLAQQNDSDLEKIYNAFKDVSAETNANIKKILSTIEEFKNKTPNEIKNLIKDGSIHKIMSQCGITDQNIVNQILKKYSELLDKDDITTSDILKELNNDLDINRIKTSNTTQLALDAIDSLKGKSRAELEALIKDNSIQTMLVQSGMPIEQARQTLNEIAKLLKNDQIGDEAIDEAIFKTLVNGFSWENIIKKIKEKNENELTDDDKLYLQIDIIKNKIRTGETLSKEEQDLYLQYENKIKEIILKLGNSAAAALIEQNNKLAEIAKKEYGDRFDDIIKELVIYTNMNPDIKIDNEYLDSITNGQFTQLNNEYRANLNTENNNTTKNDNTYYGYTTAQKSEYESALNNITTITRQIYNPEEEGFIIVEDKSKKIENEEPKQQIEITQRTAVRNGKFFTEAWTQGIIDINFLAENFNTACQEGVQKVWDFLDRNQQNRLNFLNLWHNTELSGDSAVRYDMDEKEISELGLSIGQTNFLKNRFKQLHKNEDIT